MSDAKTAFENVRQAFLSREPGRAIGRGLPVGDFLEAHRWELLREEPGKMRLGIHMPAHVRNAMGQLFGGFTPTYVDLIAILTCRAARAESENRNWIVTKSMQVEYIEPVMDGFADIKPGAFGHAPATRRIGERRSGAASSPPGMRWSANVQGTDPPRACATRRPAVRPSSWKP